MRAAVWTVANRLGAAAGTPAELRAALLAGPPPPPGPVRGALPGYDPDDIAELDCLLRDFGHAGLALTRTAVRPGPADLSDPAAVIRADAYAVTAAYEHTADGEDHGGLRTAWLRAGQALIREDAPPPLRALALLAALPAGADPAVRAALTTLSSGAPWTVTPADAGAGPVPVAALGVLAGRLLVADRAGTVRGLDARRPVTVATGARIRALAVAGNGALLLLDERGRLRVHGPGTALTDAVAATLVAHPGTALAAAAGSVLVGDRTGSVHAFGPAGLHQAALHAGRVTALAATGAAAPVVVSGGADGTVRRWRPGRTDSGAPLTRRSFPVAALHAAEADAGSGPQSGTAYAVAWADGLAELHRPGAVPLGFRPGPAVRAVAVTPDGSLVVGTDETLVRLRPNRTDRTVCAGS
ncbi:hypothetical protein [Streptomyces sp. NPDC005805]|uniref:hypothetical protein n=1 Tax=Streptomyces sp. NPDC005805 TaxID=3157068 RepID=UPI00340063A0